MTLTLNWDPFEIVTHNGVPLPRILHHAAHALLGLPVFALAVRTGWNPLYTLALAGVLAWYDKRTWIEWRGWRQLPRFHPWVPYAFDLPDFAGDFVFTLMGAFAGVCWSYPLATGLLYYALSLVNDP